MNIAVYPCKIMSIQQSYSEAFSHGPHSTGTPRDWPIDENCGSPERDYLYCPCDEMRVERIYGRGSAGDNTIWLRSTQKVIMPVGTDYLVMMVVHPQDDDLSRLAVGTLFKRGQPMFREGKDGTATGNHFHLSFGYGGLKGTGWTQNSKKAWVLTVTGDTIRPEQAVYLDRAFTRVFTSGGLTFQNPPSVPEVKYQIRSYSYAEQTDAQKWAADISAAFGVPAAVSQSQGDDAYQILLSHLTDSEKAGAISRILGKALYHELTESGGVYRIRSYSYSALDDAQKWAGDFSKAFGVTASAEKNQTGTGYQIVIANPGGAAKANAISRVLGKALYNELTEMS